MVVVSFYCAVHHDVRMVTKLADLYFAVLLKLCSPTKTNTCFFT